MNVLAIDPGNALSAYCIIDADTLRPVKFDKVENKELRNTMAFGKSLMFGHAAIEMVASYGMPVGREVFDTCRWIGRFEELLNILGVQPAIVYRKDEKLHICNDSRAKDANIRRALIDRFARHDLKNGRGTKNDPDWFYGFKADIWAAYAVGITYIETMMDPSERSI